MAFYISDRQIQRRSSRQESLPLLLLSPELTISRREFTTEFKYYSLLEDVYELKNTSASDVPYLFLPGGCLFLVFPVRGYHARSYLIGPLTSMRKINIPSGSVIFFVRIRAGSGEWLLGDKIQGMIDRVTPLSHYLPEADYLLNDMRHAESFHERTVMLFRLLASKNGEKYSPMPLLSRCIRLIYESQGSLQVTELARKVDCSARYLNQIFSARLGVSTKLFSQIVQIHYSLLYILTAKPKSLLQTAVDYGYFDQTHMNRYYRKFLNCTANDMRYADSRISCAKELPVIY